MFCIPETKYEENVRTKSSRLNYTWFFFSLFWNFLKSCLSPRDSCFSVIDLTKFKLFQKFQWKITCLFGRTDQTKNSLKKLQILKCLKYQFFFKTMESDRTRYRLKVILLLLPLVNNPLSSYSHSFCTNWQTERKTKNIEEKRP